MKIYSVNDPEFKPYGRVVTGLEAAKAEILQALATTPLPEATDYVAEEPVLQKLPAMWKFPSICLAACRSSWAGATATIPN